MKHTFTSLVIILLITVVCYHCGGSGDDGGSSDVTFDSATTPGQVVSVTMGSVTVKMIYANNQAEIVFPFSPATLTPVDDQKATLTRKFFMSETTVTNALMAEVLQWAYNNGKFSTTVSNHNGLDATTAKYGGQQLLDLDDADIKIHYSCGSFTVDTGYENYPAVCVTWYGAVMFCNWLTEMTDGDTTNVVYTGIDTSWDHLETVEDAGRTGYRLPSSEEWEYTARYIGTTAPTTENLASEYIARNHNSGNANLTAGYYWTPADYASGSDKDRIYDTYIRLVGWYFMDPDMGGSDRLMPVARKRANQLGIYDMSGNVYEWCFTESGSARVRRGGSWLNSDADMQVGYWITNGAYNEHAAGGVRIVRTQ